MDNQPHIRFAETRKIKEVLHDYSVSNFSTSRLHTIPIFSLTSHRDRRQWEKLRKEIRRWQSYILVDMYTCTIHTRMYIFRHWRIKLFLFSYFKQRQLVINEYINLRIYNCLYCSKSLSFSMNKSFSMNYKCLKIDRIIFFVIRGRINQRKTCWQLTTCY